MNMSGNTILITGGATGIGYAMANYFHKRGNTIIICGRREDRLAQAARELQGIHTIKCDVTDPDDRNLLLGYIQDHFPGLNLLINNAGIQCDIDLTQGVTDLNRSGDEIKVNLEAPIYLSALFTPLLAGNDHATIVNVSSGLAFMAERAIGTPVYNATKAGLHTFSLAQRKQLEPLGIRVVEIIPPMVESGLNPEGRKKRNVMKSPYMISSEEFAESVLAKMEQDADEIRWEKS